MYALQQRWKDDKYSSSNKSTLEDGILLSVSTDHSCVRMRHQANFTICEHITPRTTASCKSSMTCSVLGNFSLKHLFFPSDAPTKRKGNLILTISECNWSARLILFKACCTSHNNKKEFRVFCFLVQLIYAFSLSLL